MHFFKVKLYTQHPNFGSTPGCYGNLTFLYPTPVLSTSIAAHLSILCGLLALFASLGRRGPAPEKQVLNKSKAVKFQGFRQKGNR